MTICCALLSFCILWGPLTLAAETNDGLYLCGAVREINTEDAFIMVDVTSESCRGLHKFKLLTVTNGVPLIVNASKCFFIDSSSCKQGFVYTITKIEKE